MLELELIQNLISSDRNLEHTIEVQTTCEMVIFLLQSKTCFYSCTYLQVLAQDVLLQTHMIVIHAVQTQIPVDSFKDPVTVMIHSVPMVSNVEMITAQNPPMLTLSLVLILIAVIQVCQSKKRMQILKLYSFFTPFRGSLFELQRY